MDELDHERASYARAASRGLGMGRIDAQRYMEEMGPEELARLREQLIEDAEVAQTVAQGREVPFGDYLKELIAKDQVEPSKAVEVVYRAGFDIGFRSELIESSPDAPPVLAAQPGAPHVGAMDDHLAQRI